jgi:protein-disulfide isomerase-like protein with CxxC motif
MVAVAYHTDPACPWSWGLEPSLRKLMVEFADQLEWTFVMGGIARSFVAGGSRSPALDPTTLARLMREWLEVSAETQAPVDPLVWVESPIRSTYPACMAVKAAAEQAPDGGYRYLRRLREGLICERRRLDHAEALVEEGRASGLDVERFRVGLGSHAITEAFASDLERTEALAARVEATAQASKGAADCPLPSLVFGSEPPLGGFQPYEVLRETALAAGAVAVREGALGVEEALGRFGRVTTREIEVLCELPGPRAAAELFRLAEDWKLRPLRVLTGYLWESAAA